MGQRATKGLGLHLICPDGVRRVSSSVYLLSCDYIPQGLQENFILFLVWKEWENELSVTWSIGDSIDIPPKEIKGTPIALSRKCFTPVLQPPSFWYLNACLLFLPGNVEAEMLHTYIKVDPLDKLILSVRLAVLLAVTLTVPVVLFPVRSFSPIVAYSSLPPSLLNPRSASSVWLFSFLLFNSSVKFGVGKLKPLITGMGPYSFYCA